MKTYSYSVSPEDMDSLGNILVPSLCRSVINSIGHYIKEEGFGVDVMRESGFCWVLSRYAFEFDSRPSLYKNYDITVWDGESGNITLSRCLRLTDSKGKEIGRGVSDWCVIDRKTRTLLKPAALLRNMKGKEAPCPRPERIAAVTVDESETRKVHFSDCDFNGHVNNVKYVEMFYDMLPEGLKVTRRPLRLSAFFHKEARLGDTLTLGLGKTGEGYNFVVASPGFTVCTLALRSM